MARCVHAFANFHHNVTVMDERSKVVLREDNVRNRSERDAHVFIARHRRVQVKIRDVYRHVLRVECGNNTVEMALDGGDIDSGRANVVRIIYFVTTTGKANTVLFGFVRFFSCNNTQIGGFARGRFGIVSDEEHGFGTGWHVRCYALRETADFVGCGLDPLSGIGTLFEVAIFECCTGGWINDRIGKQQ